MKKLVITLLLVFSYLYTVLLPQPALAAQLLRVALVTGQASAEISCDADFVVQSAGEQAVVPKGKYFLHVNEAGRLALDEKHVFGSSISISPAKGKLLPKINQRSYKGSLKAMVENGRLLVVNYVDVEQFLYSVLPDKTMVVWPDAAIKAQAVAARSYAYYMRQLHVQDSYDLLATDKELPYEGTGARIEKAGVTKLVKATAGQYLAVADGQPIKAVTTSSTGGRTESAQQAWNKEISYLPSVEDYDSDSPDNSWEQLATPALLESQLAQRGYVVGRLTSIRLSPLSEPDTDRTATGRVRYVILSGEQGTAKISGTELAEILGLRSTLFDITTGTPLPESLRVPIEDRYGFEVGSKEIDIKLKENNKPVWSRLMRSYHLLGGSKEEKIILHGRGRGAGIGLSAWGARGMVNNNEKITYQEVLQHYYPGTFLRK